jgi:hypothetical protein
MKQFIRTLAILAFLAHVTTESVGQNPHEQLHKAQAGIIQDVLQTSSYTYLQFKANNSLQWLAVPTMQYKAGDSCYYNNGMLMTDFVSKELKRTFKSVVFLERVSKTYAESKNPSAVIPEHRSKTPTGKLSIKVEPAEGGITIVELLRNKDKYKDKKVKIRGQVTKFNAHILGKNWVHLQDGTSFGDKYDLTATLSDSVSVGNIVTVFGTVTLNKDFGSGYFFEVLMEDATKK